MMSLEELRHKHTRFFFDQVSVLHKDQELIVTLKYHFQDGPSFSSVYTFPYVTQEMMADRDMNLLRTWAAHLGMVEGMSYWKAACSPEWVIAVPGITTEQFPFWDNLLKKGLSEFFFIHQIHAWQENFVEFTLDVQGQTAITKDSCAHQHRALIPVGGGKDSVVTTELLRTEQLPLTTMSIKMYPQLERVLNVFWNNTLEGHHIEVDRQLDTKLLELNQTGYLNGHTPFSAMIAFSSTFAAYLYDYQLVPLSNEWSANEGNTTFFGQTINHQYSKTIEFEEMFRTHLHTYLSETIEYFSYLRPLHELQIAELFTHYTQYWPVFLSCNRGQKQGKWCGECPKCVFVAMMLSAFLSNEQLHEIFAKDILEDKALIDIVDQLAGFTEVKSLECVGTRDETRAALALAYQQLSPVPALVEYGWQKLLEQGNNNLSLLQSAAELRQEFVKQHFIPTELAAALEQKIQTQ